MLTHADVIERLDRSRECPVGEDCRLCDALRALKAIAEMHKPGLGVVCYHCSYEYPCPTFRAVSAVVEPKEGE